MDFQNIRTFRNKGRVFLFSPNLLCLHCGDRLAGIKDKAVNHQPANSRSRLLDVGVLRTRSIYCFSCQKLFVVKHDIPERLLGEIRSGQTKIFYGAGSDNVVIVDGPHPYRPEEVVFKTE